MIFRNISCLRALNLKRNRIQWHWGSWRGEPDILENPQCGDTVMEISGKKLLALLTLSQMPYELLLWNSLLLKFWMLPKTWIFSAFLKGSEIMHLGCPPPPSLRCQGKGYKLGYLLIVYISLCYWVKVCMFDFYFPK